MQQPPTPDALTITILGCGSSAGVPRIGNIWGACDPSNPKNRRRRCALLVERHGPAGTTTVLVDTGPDMREQLLSANVSWVDGVLFTHAHADHMHGIDDLRAMAVHYRRRVDVYMDDMTFLRADTAFGYCFATPPESNYPPILTRHRMTSMHSFAIDGAGGSISVLPFEVEHGDIHALGFRFGPSSSGGLAYLPDVSAIPAASAPALANLDIWVLDCLRRTPHPSHFSLNEALEAAERFKPSRTVLTNLHIDLDHDRLNSETPDWIEPAHDGMQLRIGN